MEDCQNRLALLADKLRLCQKTLAAVGDPTRQQIFLALLSSDYNGIRVGEAAAKSHLSRPAVSRHLNILKEAGLIHVRREGTKSYYCLNANQALWRELLELVQLTNELVDAHLESFPKGDIPE